jgi:membrane-associated protease RseP (regulator of RpoE activity)
MNSNRKTFLIQVTLFIITFFTTTFAGSEWVNSSFFPWNYSWQDFQTGLKYSIPFLGALTVHEFGHFLTARYYRIEVTLPYYLPVWLGFLGAPSLGTMGAFIRIKEAIKSRKEFFDVGVAGPIAGFVIALGVVWYGFTSLPPQDYIYEIHPEYLIWGEDYKDVVFDKDTIVYKSNIDYLSEDIMEQLPDTIRIEQANIIKFGLGKNLLFLFFEKYVVNEPTRIPPKYEMIHYPFLFAGYLALFFTALNLLPIGQLDGGHVLYGLLGSKKANIVSAIVFVLFVFYGGLGLITPASKFGDNPNDLLSHLLYIAMYVFLLYFIFYSITPQKQTRWLIALSIFAAQYLTTLFLPDVKGYHGWLVFGLLIGRFLGVYHPKALQDEPLSFGRKVIGCLALIIFILCFAPQALIVE